MVKAAQAKGLVPLSLASDVQEIFGKGVQGIVRTVGSAGPVEVTNDVSPASARQQVGRPIAVGNRTFMRLLDMEIPPLLLEERDRRVARGEIGSFLAVDNRVVGLLVLADLPRPELDRLCHDLKQAGIKETILLTGDGQVVAQRIGTLAQMDQVVANCLPEDKVRTIRRLVNDHHQVLMVVMASMTHRR